MERVAVGTEVSNVEGGQLSVSASGRQRRPHEQPERLRAGVNQPLSLVDRKIANARCIDARVGLYVAPWSWSGPPLRGEIKRRLEHG